MYKSIDLFAISEKNITEYNILLKEKNYDIEK